MEPVLAVGLILLGLVGLGFLTILLLAYRFFTQVLSDQREFSRAVISKLLLYNMAESAEEAVTLDVNTEALRDAIAKAEANKEEETKELEPRLVNTDDGRQIDLRDWEPL